jgi:hypothetical protein
MRGLILSGDFAAEISTIAEYATSSRVLIGCLTDQEHCGVALKLTFASIAGRY